MPSVGQNINANGGLWSFGEGVPKEFDNHVSNQVPFYKEGHELILDLLPFFIRKNSKILDIGCSTGILVNKIAEKYKSYDLSIKAVDIEEDMIKEADSRNYNENIEFICENFVYNKYNSYDVIISFYTMQFVPPAIRQEAFNNIFKSLNWGGTFLFFEKVRAPDARFQDLSNQLYAEYKESKGFSAEQIANKSKSLKGVLEPFSTQGNLEMIKRASFVDIWPIFKWICFEGFCVVK